LIAEQAGQIAYSIVDSQTIDMFLTSLYRPYEANTIEDLAQQLGVDPAATAATVDAFNRAIVPGGTFDMSKLDDCRTEGLDPPKSHWAQPINKPPFYGYALRPGITFTYLGLKVNQQARVQLTNGEAIRNLYAAGEIMSGNVLWYGYLGGFGLTIGHVFGRIAGTEAAKHAAD
jgi:tricarballylate dehydrogenase